MHRAQDSRREKAIKMPHSDAIQKGIDMKIHDGKLVKIKYRKVAGMLGLF